MIDPYFNELYFYHGNNNTTGEAKEEEEEEEPSGSMQTQCVCASC